MGRSRTKSSWAIVAPLREQVRIATTGFDLDSGQRGEAQKRPKHITEVLVSSLKPVEVDTIDLLYQHRVDPDVPIEDVARTSPRGRGRNVMVL